MPTFGDCKRCVWAAGPPDGDGSFTADARGAVGGGGDDPRRAGRAARQAAIFFGGGSGNGSVWWLGMRPALSSLAALARRGWLGRVDLPRLDASAPSRCSPPPAASSRGRGCRCSGRSRPTARGTPSTRARARSRFSGSGCSPAAARARAGRRRCCSPACSPRRSCGRSLGKAIPASSRTASARPGCETRSATGTGSRCSPTWRCRSRSGSGRGAAARWPRPARCSSTPRRRRSCSPPSRTGVLARLVAVALWLVLADRRVEGALLGLAGALPAAALARLGVHAARARRRRPGARRPRPRRRRRSACSRSSGRSRRRGGRLGVAARATAPRSGRAGARRSARPRVPRPDSSRSSSPSATRSRGAGISSRARRRPAPTPGRLTSLGSNNRWQWWNEAADVWQADPATGAGAGTFELARQRFRENAPAGDAAARRAAAGARRRRRRRTRAPPRRDRSRDGGVPSARCGGSAGRSARPPRARGAARGLGRARARRLRPRLRRRHARRRSSRSACSPRRDGRLVRARRPFWAIASGRRRSRSARRCSSPDARRTRGVDRSTRALERRDFAAAVDDAERARSLNPFALDPLRSPAPVREWLGGDRAAALRPFREAVDLQPRQPRRRGRRSASTSSLAGDLCRPTAR